MRLGMQCVLYLGICSSWNKDSYKFVKMLRKFPLKSVPLGQAGNHTVDKPWLVEDKLKIKLLDSFTDRD